MAVNIKLKRSSVPGNIPTTAQLELGEIALNTYDGKAFFKIQTGTSQSIVEIASTGSTVASASYALYAASAGTASFAYTATTASYSLNTTSASYALNATTASYAVTATSASYALTASSVVSASYALNATSASYAATSSYASNFNVSGNLDVGGNITATTLYVQTVTSSIIYSSGSNVFGDATNDTQTLNGTVSISGSFNITGSATINDLTGSLYGTSSWALSASYVPGLSLSSIATGSISASVDIDPNNLFLIKSGSTIYFNISSSSNTTLYSDLFIVKNFTTQQSVLTISQSIVQFATQSFNPSGTTTAGSIWFTSSSMYIGLEN
jgi:hypothetical protein